MNVVLNSAINAVLAARPEPTHALSSLAEELRRNTLSQAPTPASSEEVALQAAVQRAMGTATATAPRDCSAALVVLMERQQGVAARDLIKLMVQAGLDVDEGSYLPLHAIAQRRGDWREARQLSVWDAPLSPLPRDSAPSPAWWFQGLRAAPTYH